LLHSNRSKATMLRTTPAPSAAPLG
jgi:hypothetical protein